MVQSNDLAVEVGCLSSRLLMPEDRIRMIYGCRDLIGLYM
jgi:hypothetical protein